MIMRHFTNLPHANTTNLSLVDVHDDDEFFQATTPVQRYRCLDLSTTDSTDASIMLKRTIGLVNKYDVSVPRMLRGEINTLVQEKGDDVDALTEQSRKHPFSENDPFSDPLFSDYDELLGSDEVFSDSSHYDSDEVSETGYRTWEADRPRTPVHDEKCLVCSCSTPTRIEQIRPKCPDRSATPATASASLRRGRKSDRREFHVQNHEDRRNFGSIGEWMVVSVLILMMVVYNEHIAFSAECMTTPASLNPCGRGIDIKNGAVSFRASPESTLMDEVSFLPLVAETARDAEEMPDLINEEQESWHWASSLNHCG